MTILAAFMPNNSASAATPNSMTDNVTVQVIDSVPAVEVLNPKSGEMISSLDETLKVHYDNISNFTVTITFIDENGVEHTEVIDEVEPDQEHGDLDIPFREFGADYGYGEYIIKVTGVGVDGSEVEDAVKFEYVAVTADVKMDEETGITDIKLDYADEDPDLDEEDKVAKVVINVYDEGGNIVDEISPIEVNAPGKEVTIPFDDYNLPSGDYTIVITPYNASGKELYKELTFVVHYNGLLVPSTADTGGLFTNLNIAKSDYLITGVIVFSLIGIAGIVFISRKNRNNSSRRRK
jgi:hypothetical protein